MKKESLSAIIIKILLAILLFTGMGTIIVGGGYIIGEYSKNKTNNQITKLVDQGENYYDALEKKCNSDGCCLASLKIMRENNYKEANENSKCPEGFNGNMMRCITSYQWCEPIEKKCAKAGEFVNPDNLKGKTNHPDICCEGLKGVGAYKVNEDGECEIIIGTPYLTCIPCGNGVCDEIDLWFENKCNCPEDCGEKIETSDWQTYRNEEFGFEFEYPNNEEIIQEENRFYLGNKNGQFVEIYNKKIDEVLNEAIENKFLKEYPSDDCYVKQINLKSYPNNFIAALIFYNDKKGEESSWRVNPEKCPKHYSQTNGVRYFLADKNISDKFAFFSIGQYAVVLNEKDSSTEWITWQSTFKFTEN